MDHPLPARRRGRAHTAAARRAGACAGTALLAAALTVTGLGALTSPAVAAAGQDIHAAGPTSPAAGGQVARTEYAPGAATVPGQAVSVTVQLAPSSPATLAALAAGRRPPARRVSAAAQLASAGPTPSAVAAVTSALRSAGLTVTASTGWAVQVTGTPDQVEHTFGVHLLRDATGIHPDRPLSVPAPLAGLVVGATGADTRPLLHAKSAGAPSAPAPRPAGNVTAHATGSMSNVPGLNPDQVRAAFGVTAAGADGHGTTVATVQFSGWNAADLGSYAAIAGLPAPNLTQVSVDGASVSTPSGGGDTEVTLDQEAILGQAPQAAQRVYIAPNTSQGFLDALNQVATDASTDHSIVALSISWGFCEPSFAGADAFRSAMETALSHLTAAGVTVFAASGDEGAYDCSAPSAADPTLAVDFPAVSPNVVAVGGTTVSPTSGGYTQVTWDRPGCPSGGCDPAFAGYASGGGQSGSTSGYTATARPSWQSALSQSGSGRLVPDLASVADASTGYPIYLGGQWTYVMGTSIASPVTAGDLAAELSALGRTSGLGDIHPGLYAASAYTDITSGSNFAYVAGSGFDETTGLGAPRWDVLAAALTGQSTTTPTPTQPVPTPTPSPTQPAPSPTQPAPSPTQPAPSPTQPDPAPPVSAPPAPVPNPVLTLPTLSRTRTVPVRVSLPSGTSWNGFAVGLSGATGCATTLTHTPPSSLTLPGDGHWRVTLAAVDSSGGCHLVSAGVQVDTAAPQVTVRVQPLRLGRTRLGYVHLTWSTTDPGGSGVQAVVEQVSVAGRTVRHRHVGAGGGDVIMATYGAPVTIGVTAWDRAGNSASAAATATTRPVAGTSTRPAASSGPLVAATAATVPVRGSMSGQALISWTVTAHGAPVRTVVEVVTVNGHVVRNRRVRLRGADQVDGPVRGQVRASFTATDTSGHVQVRSAGTTLASGGGAAAAGRVAPWSWLAAVLRGAA